VIATWWVGLFLGIPLALVARCGSRAKLSAKQIAPSIFKLLAIMAACALAAGLTGFVLASRGAIQLPQFIVSNIPADHRVRFMADWWAHSASYLAGFLGGIIVIVRSGLRRRTGIASR
jgi:hypothetical protein